jgi:PKD repeat protein
VGIGDEGHPVCEPINFPPIAKAQANPNTGVVDSAIAFDGSGSFDLDGDIPLLYLWDFGDFTTSTEESPVHAYSTAGIFTATLTVTDFRGATSIPITVEVDVQEDLGPVTPSSSGDLVITEIMHSPGSLGENVGQYFEIFNPTATQFTLRGCRITTSDGSHDITTDEIIDPGVYFVLAITAGAAPPLDPVNDPSLPYYVYGDVFRLDPDVDTIELTCNGDDIDTVAYDVYDNDNSFPVASEASLNLDPGALDADANDFGSNWCVTPPSFDTLAGRDVGTPIVANGTCPKP